MMADPTHLCTVIPCPMCGHDGSWPSPASFAIAKIQDELRRAWLAKRSAELRTLCERLASGGGWDEPEDNGSAPVIVHQEADQGEGT